MTETPMSTGTTSNGVPYVARRAEEVGAPVIAAWHLLDPPRTEAAFSAALPLSGLDATVIYFGLPLSGSRMPEGGVDTIMSLAADDPVTRLFGPICLGAIEEFPHAFADARSALGVSEDARVGLLGGSAGSAVAAGVLAGGESGAAAAVLVSPMLQLRALIDEVAPFFGIAAYEWKPDSRAIADRLDFVARSADATSTGAAVRVIAGADDGNAALLPAEAFATAAGADLHVVDGVGHALAEEPGVEPAPQTDGARRFDALAAAWFREHLS